MCIRKCYKEYTSICVELVQEICYKHFTMHDRIKMQIKKKERNTMFKRTMSLVMAIVMVVGIGIQVSAVDLEAENSYVNTVTAIYDVVNTSDWLDMERPDRIARCQIPTEVQEKLSTSDLIQAVLDFPFFIDIFAFDTIGEGYTCVLSECEALQTLINRTDKTEAMLEFYASMDVPQDIETISRQQEFSDLWKMELLISQDDFVHEMSEEQKACLVNIAESKLFIKSQHTDIYSGNIACFFEAASENSGLELYIIDSQVYTPAGSAVSVYKWTSSDIDFSTSEINSLNAEYAEAYPNATRLGNPSKKYNCHSYAWYSQSTSNIYWMNNPSKYMTDGSYSEVSKIHTDVGDRMVYFLSTDGTNTGINHSAVIVSYVDYPRSKRTFVVKSKWGQLGLYKHSWADGPYMNWDGNQYPSDLEYYH